MDFISNALMFIEVPWTTLYQVIINSFSFPLARDDWIIQIDNVS